jgi:hypothetical protein
VKDDAGIDPITREVIRGWLETAAEEMQNALIKSAHSMLVVNFAQYTGTKSYHRLPRLLEVEAAQQPAGIAEGFGQAAAGQQD